MQLYNRTQAMQKNCLQIKFRLLNNDSKPSLETVLSKKILNLKSIPDFHRFAEEGKTCWRRSLACEYTCVWSTLTIQEAPLEKVTLHCHPNRVHVSSRWEGYLLIIFIDFTFARIRPHNYTSHSTIIPAIARFWLATGTFWLSFDPIICYLLC